MKMGYKYSRFDVPYKWEKCPPRVEMAAGKQQTREMSGHLTLSAAGLKYRSQVTGCRSQVKIKNTCEFAVSSNLVHIYFLSLYSLFIPTKPMMSSYFSKIPCSSNNA